MSHRIDTSYQRILQIAGPVLVANLSYTAMGVIDTIMVGRLGVTALAAVGLGNLISFTALSFFWGLLAGVNTLVAQAVGARDRRAVGRVFWQGIYLAAACAVTILLFYPLIPRIFEWAGASREVQVIGADYMRVRIGGAFGVSILLVCDNFYRGLGRTRLIMWCGLLKLVFNCGLNYVFIFGAFGTPQMGAAGAALGTVCAQFLVGGALFWSIVFYRPVRDEFEVAEGWRFRPRLAGRLFGLSLPIAIQTSLEMGGIAVFSAMVSRLGDAQLAATNAVIQAWSVAFMGAVALSVGSTTLVGQCIGAGRVDDCRPVVRRVENVGYLFTAVVGVIYIAWPKQLMALFISAEELGRIAPYARPLFAVVVLCLVFDLKFNLLSGALRGAGDTAFPMWVNIGSAWLLFVPGLFILTPRFGLIGAWSCFVFHVVVMATLLELRIRGDRWLRKPQHSFDGDDDGPTALDPVPLGDRVEVVSASS